MYHDFMPTPKCLPSINLYYINVDNFHLLRQEDYNSNNMSREELTEHLGLIREKYVLIKENILDENTKTLAEFEKKYMDSVQSRIEKINNNEELSSFIEAVWNSETHSIELIRK